MAEYIERDFVLDVVKRTSGDYAAAFCEIAHHKAGRCCADVAPVVHGKWIYGEDIDIQCSVCGADALTEGDYRQIKSRYCPNCGAKMSGENNAID